MRSIILIRGLLTCIPNYMLNKLFREENNFFVAFFYHENKQCFSVAYIRFLTNFHGWHVTFPTPS